MVPRTGKVSYELSGEFPESPTSSMWRVTLFMYVDGLLAISVTARSPYLDQAVDTARATMIEAQTELQEYGRLLMDTPDAMIRYGDAIARAR